MWRLVHVALANIWLLIVLSASVHAQVLAPTTLGLASHDQKAADDMVQVITEKSAQKTADKPPKPITKKRVPVIAKKPAQVIAKKPVQAITRDSARMFTIEPVRPIEKPSTSEATRPVTHYSYKTPQGKKESVPVITQYYPNRIVYPFAKVDRHIDPKLMQAATIAQERAHAHSRSMCWHYVKEALLASGVIDSRPKSELARDAAQDLVSNYGFKRLSVTDPFAAPIGSVLVYGTTRSVGHVELRTRDGFVSDFSSKTPSPRPLLGVYAKL